MKRILLLDPEGEPARNVLFILRMAGYRALRSHTPHEAANMVLNLRAAGEPVDLVVVGHRGRAQLRELSGILEGAGVAVPILVVRREDDPPLPLPPGCHLCFPSALLRRIEELLVPSPPAGLP